MTMLSRVADRLFWMARYLERAEDTSRLVHAYSHLVMDIPKGSEPGWGILVNILDAQPTYEEHYRVYNEHNVLKFLIADLDNVGGIYHAIRAARENVRTTRDVLPEEAGNMSMNCTCMPRNTRKNRSADAIATSFWRQSLPAAR